MSTLFKFLGRVIIVIFSSALILALVLFIKYFDRLSSIYTKAELAVDSISDTTFVQSENSYIYDASGNLLLELSSDRYSLYMPLYTVDSRLQDIVIAIEDQRFFEHKGVDLLSTSKAFYLLLTEPEIVRGGSTISQQLAKNVFLSFEKTLDRKLCEIIISLKLERRYSKYQILEFYLNNINYGGNVYGFRSASKKYFNKEPSELSLNEMIYLAGIPQNPTKLNPMKGVKYGMERRDILLETLVAKGIISDTEYKECKETPIVLNPSFNEVNDYLTSYALHCSIEKLMLLNGFNFKYVFRTQDEYNKYKEDYDLFYMKIKESLMSGGYKIETSLDPKVYNDIQYICTIMGQYVILDCKNECIYLLVFYCHHKLVLKVVIRKYPYELQFVMYKSKPCWRVV